MNSTEFLDKLSLALERYRYGNVRLLTDNLDLSTFTFSQIKQSLWLLRRKRLFPDLEHLASLLTMSGMNEPIIRRLWAQSLLDQNRIDQALRALVDMAKQSGTHQEEGPEIRGLIGRAYKQLFVNEGRHDHLKRSIASYAPDWREKRGDYRWHGINLVALLARSERDGIPIDFSDSSQSLASTILEDITDKGVTGVWDYATAMEASVALGNQSSAMKWAKEYLQHPATDAFEIGSTLRQLKEIWQLEKTPLGDTLLPVLECALLQKEGGSVEPIVLAGKVRDEGFEAVWGEEAYVYLDWIDNLYRRCNAIARIFDTATGAPKGTGFLTVGSAFHPKWGAAPVLLTNSHVISDNLADEAPLRPGEASAEFTRLPGRPRVPLEEMRFTSARTQLDISIFKITPPNGYETLSPYPHLPHLDTADTVRPRIYVIGHPGGRELAVSLYDNSLEEYESQYVRYRSPTEGGHSGSPVFDRQLHLFAIHHRAREDKQLNEGVLLRDIQAARIP